MFKRWWVGSWLKIPSSYSGSYILQSLCTDHRIPLIKTTINCNLFWPPFSHDNLVLWYLAKTWTSQHLVIAESWGFDIKGHHTLQQTLGNLQKIHRCPLLACILRPSLQIKICYQKFQIWQKLPIIMLFLTSWHFYVFFDILHFVPDLSLTSFSHTLSKNFDNFLPLLSPYSQHNTMSTPSNTLRHSPAFGPFQTIPMITLHPPTPLLPTSSTDTILISSAWKSPTTSQIALPQYPPASYWPATPFASSMVETIPTLILDLLLCPNVDCNIRTQHTYSSMTLMPSPQHQQLHLSQFLLGQSPLPRTSCWMLATKPEQLLQQGNQYFLLEYRVVWLQHITELQEMDWEWEIFFRVNLEEYSRKLMIVVPKTWVAIARDLAPMLYMQLLSYFSFLC